MFMRYFFITLFLFLQFTLLIAQEIPKDSAQTLQEITVKAYEQNRKLMHVPAAVAVVSKPQLLRFNNTNLLPALNTVAGVRMEERSPGSYRLNIRGSSLRSPFGVRNIKVYWNDIPITDPGGNTYFNQFAFNNLGTITIFKGPAGSLYGAGTGGLIMAESMHGWYRKPGIDLEYIGGSYGMQTVLATLRAGKP